MRLKHGLKKKRILQSNRNLFLRNTFDTSWSLCNTRNTVHKHATCTRPQEAELGVDVKHGAVITGVALID